MIFTKPIILKRKSDLDLMKSNSEISNEEMIKTCDDILGKDFKNMIEKEKRIQLCEDDEVILEKRANKYYLSIYDEDGNFRREVILEVDDDYKVKLYNGK